MNNDIFTKELLKNFNEIYEQKCKTKYLPSTLPAQDKILVLGDIHGDFNMLIHLLRKGKVIDKRNNWVGKKTIVVQVGDQIDSCRPNRPGDCLKPDYTQNDKAEDIKVLMFMTDLHEKAQKHGGAIYSLVGNHELMNVDGDMNYVSYENLNEFGGEYGRQVAFKPGNKMANYLACTRKMALIIGSNLFVHAGFEPKLVREYGIDDINKLMALYLLGELRNPNNFREDFMVKSNSPLWTRTFGNINMSNNTCERLMKPLKDVYKVGRIYVGHTPQLEEGINSTCDGRIWRTDVGVSNAFDNVDPKMISSGKKTKYRNGQLLEIINDEDINIIS
tara:strand:- start:328 stop:1323 length:996 start_codon:yes stop_codon:yes gene_type:complete